MNSALSNEERDELRRRNEELDRRYEEAMRPLAQLPVDKFYEVVRGEPRTMSAEEEAQFDSDETCKR